jgi:hypothetical protein
MARLRAQGGLVEVGAADLAMDSQDASALLKGAGVQAGAARVEQLVQLTEGWAAGLYLAALAMRAGAPESDMRSRFAGDDRFMGDYLRSELLDRLSDAEVSFMCRTSVLDRMCGPLCDAVLQRSGSGQFLEWMERRNLLVVALDRRRADADGGRLSLRRVAVIATGGAGDSERGSSEAELLRDMMVKCMVPADRILRSPEIVERIVEKTDGR